MIIDLTNKQFGRWFVNQRGPNTPSGKTAWYCVCVCGCHALIQSSHLRRGLSTQCIGCAKFRGHQQISLSYWSSLINNAKRRNYEFSISIQEAWNQFVKQESKCALTGQVLIFARNFQTDTQTASLDRIDSSKGYVAKNIQWVHKDINLLKGSIDDLKFIELCQMVASYRGNNSHEPLSKSGH